MATTTATSTRRTSVTRITRTRPKERRRRPAVLNLVADEDGVIDIGLASTATASRLLAERGFHTTSRAFDRNYTLHWAAREGETAIVRMLLGMWHGAELTPPPSASIPGMKPGSWDWASDGWTPLHSAASHGHAAVVELLLDYTNGPDVNARTKDGWTPLHWASKNGHLGVVRTLLRRKADPKIRTNEGATALEWADQGKHREVCGLLSYYAAVKVEAGRRCSVY